MKVPFGVIANKAKKLPGETAATVPPSNINRINKAATFPRIGPKTVIGFINAYGKAISPIPPANMIKDAAGADFLAIPLPNKVNASSRSEEHTSELQSRGHLVCRLLLEKKKKK